MTYDAIAQLIIGEAIRRGYDPVPPLADAIQESGLRPAVVSANGKWIGIYQQDSSYSDRNNPTANIMQFFDRLDAKRKTPGWSQDLWLNIFWLQQRPGESSAELAYANGRQAYLTEIKSRTSEAQRYVALYGGTMPALPVLDYGITKVMHGYNPDTGANCTGNSNGPRAKTLYVVFHTQEGDGTAVSLANYLNGTRGASGVSYNLTVDDTDTVEVVPVGEGPWAAMEANNIAVHICIAGSRAAWTNEQWMKRVKSLDRAAKAAAAACRQYDIPAVKVLSTNGWPVTPKGLAAHADFGVRGGGHTDPGAGFPWAYVTNKVSELLGATPTSPEVPVSENPYAVNKPGTEGGQVSNLWDQLLIRWDILGGRTPVEALAAACAKLGVPGCIDVKAGQ